MALEIRVSNLLPLVSFATRQGGASDADLAALEAEVALKANKATTITAAGLATGGGDLSANRTITVPKATGAEAAALAENTMAITPYSLSFPLNTIKAYTVTGGGLATGGGALSTNPVLTVPKATAAEASALTNDTKAVTPLALAGPINDLEAEILAIGADVAGSTEDASYARFDRQRRTRGVTLPKALVLILIGQSNNTSMNIQISGIVSENAYMAVGGNARTIDGCFGGSFFASAVVHTEGFPKESPLSGAITTLIGSTFSRIYGCVVAVGGTTIDTESAGLQQCDLQAAAYRLCDLARNAGYDPVIAFSNHQGEADMSALNSETDHYNDGRRYYAMAQRVAAMAMEKPDYVAPITFHHPITMYQGTDGAAARAINNSIRRLATDIPNAVYGGGSYHYESNSDRVHQSAPGFRTRGEHVGYLLRRLMCESIREIPLQVIDVAWSGTTATVLFNHEVVRDTAFDWGQNLSTTKQLGGFEWEDNGVLIQVTALTVSGRKVVLTLASTPVGTLAQQKLRVASQTTTSSPLGGSNNRPGSQIRVNETGRAAIYMYGNATYGTHYRWAIPQLCNVRAAP